MVPFLDLKRQTNSIYKQLTEASEEVLQSGSYILGSKVKNLENEIEKFIGIKHAIGVASGTDALELAIKSLNIPKNSKVIVPANCYPTIWGVLKSGVTPVICDVNPEKLTLDEKKLETLITQDTKAIVVVHLYGFNMLSDNLIEIAKRNNMFIIEDCAQSFGSRNGDSYLGTLGDVAIFSFYPTKPLGAFGDCGMVITNDDDIANRTNLLRCYGEQERYHSVMEGINSRLDELQANFLLVKLPLVNSWNEERRDKSNLYRQELQNVGDISFIQNVFWDKSSHHLFIIKTSKRDELRKFLKHQGIETLVHYPVSLSQVGSISNVIEKGDCEVSESLSNTILSLPLFNGILLSEQNEVIKTIKSFFEDEK